MKINKNNQYNHLKTNISAFGDDFKLDTRIIPLFRTPITLQKMAATPPLLNAGDNGFAAEGINQKLKKYSNTLNTYKIKYILKNDVAKAGFAGTFNLKKVLWPLHIKNANNFSRIIQIFNAGLNKRDKISNLHLLYNLTARRSQATLNKILNNKTLKKSGAFSRIGLNKFYASLYYSPSTAAATPLSPTLNYKRIKLELSSLCAAPMAPRLNVNKDFKNLINAGAEGANNFKKIIEIRNLLLIIKNMQNHVESIINLRKELILKRRMAATMPAFGIKNILSPSSAEGEKNNLKAVYGGGTNNNLSATYNNELTPLMLANSFVSDDRQSAVTDNRQSQPSALPAGDYKKLYFKYLSPATPAASLFKKGDKYLFLNKQVLDDNKKKMVETIRSMILKHKLSASPPTAAAVDLTGVGRAPVNIIYGGNNKPLISHYLKSMSYFNMIKKGTFIYFSNSIGYNFKNGAANIKKFKNIYKFLLYFFKTMYCLISKPVFVFKSDKIIIQLFYFVITPNFFKDNILRKNVHYNKLMNKFKQRKIKRKPFKYAFGIAINSRIRKRIFKFNKLKLKIRIALKKASNVSLIKLYPNKFKILCNILSKAFNKNIELNLIRLHYPYNNSNILANLLALLINKIKFRRITRKLFKFAVIKNINASVNKGAEGANYLPAYLTGMNIKIAGRLMNYNIIPRKTVQKIQKGSSSFGKVNYTDFARYTAKNRRGAFSITVSSGQNFFN